jgi:hypothetical protein
MAETVIQSVYRFEWDAAMRLAVKGDENAQYFLENIWQAYKDQTIACFICNSDILVDGTLDGLPKTQVLPEQLDNSKLILVPVCATCWARPTMARINAAIAILKEMFARQGKQVHFNFGPRRTPPQKQG